MMTIEEVVEAFAEAVERHPSSVKRKWLRSWVREMQEALKKPPPEPVLKTWYEKEFKNHWEV